MTDLIGKVALVTGASRGVGRCIACRLARMGASVALLAHRRADLEATEQEIGAVARTLVVPVDLAVPESFASVKQRIETELGKPSILVNAAGVFGPIDLVKDTDPAAWIETIMINSIAPYVTCRAFVAGMIAGGAASSTSPQPLLCTNPARPIAPTPPARRR